MVGHRSTGDIVDDRVLLRFPRYLRSGDALVINTSATIPAAVPATNRGRRRGPRPSVDEAGRGPVDGRGQGACRVRKPARSRPATHRLLVLARRRGGNSAVTSRLLAADVVRRGSGARAICMPTWQNTGARSAIGTRPRHGISRPTRPFMPTSPGRSRCRRRGDPFTTELLARWSPAASWSCRWSSMPESLRSNWGSGPAPEQRRVPLATASAINALRADGGRVIAVGTTVTRALESAADVDGTVRAAEGLTDIVIGPDRPPRVVDGLITGWHEPKASHLELVEAVAGSSLAARMYERALATGYLWHEFGDSCLILP